MLTHITIDNFVLIDHVAIDLIAGLTIITGETGAGKSIIMDALELALGSRIEGQVVRQGAERSDVTVCFDITHNTDARAWLASNDIEAQEECIIRRTINTDGRSRATINGIPMTLQHIRDLTNYLITVHGQHQHQALVTRQYQRKLLDESANNFALCEKVAALHQQWQTTQNKLTELNGSQHDNSAEIELLEYQIAELDELTLQEGEYALLDQEHHQLSHVDDQIQRLNFALQLLSQNDDGAIVDRLFSIERELQSQQHHLPELTDLMTMISNATILVQESAAALQRLLDRLEPNPVRLQELETRITLIHRLARKHHVEPHALHSLHAELQSQLYQLRNADSLILQLREQLADITRDYAAAAKKLSVNRQSAAKPLSKNITQQLQHLSLTGATLAINVTTNTESPPTQHGQDTIEFLFSANPGQNLAPLSKVASGGEISRIGLAIHVVTVTHANGPTLVFDEVDVGIGGPTAAIVGRLLRQLGLQTQILCITHLPQVAANGHQHWHVSKHTHNKTTTTHIECLNAETRAKELARMLGGIDLTDEPIANAKALLAACAENLEDPS
ncbi:MAG: DNA repair protein RecN [Pseudomonadota bacterium]|nr:DNA repair protein RecN [Pseudomonadota bacterium]